jgi:hypothetical protein
VKIDDYKQRKIVNYRLVGHFNNQLQTLIKQHEDQNEDVMSIKQKIIDLEEERSKLSKKN